MRKLAIVTLLVLFVCAFANAQPAAKNAVQVSTANLINYQPTSLPWQNILSTNIKTSSQKDLLLGVSLETGLLTETFVKTKGSDPDTAEATAGIEVRVCANNISTPGAQDCGGVGGLPGYKVAEPGVVMFDKRLQRLTARLANILGTCYDVDGDGVVEIPDECISAEITLLLETLAAHHFNFALDDVGVGNHEVKVQARINIDKNAGLGSADAKAMVGKGSLSVEEVRLVKGVEIVIP